MTSTALERQILSQPDELERVARIEIGNVIERLAPCARIWLIGTGTSQHAAELGAAMLHEAGRAAQAVSSMHFVTGSHPVDPRDAVVVISHNAGAETAYAAAARARSLEAGLAVVSITRQGGGLPEAVETVAKETSETYTVSYTTCLLLLARMAGALGATAFTEETVRAVPDAVRRAIDAPGVDAIAQPPRLLLIFGSGPASVTAREGALKVREASRFPAEGYDAEYLLHGSAVPLTPDDHLVALLPPGPDGFTRAVAAAAASEGIPLTVIEETADLPPLLAQIPLTIRLQLLALRFAAERGQDPDHVITGSWADPGLWALGAP